MGDGYSLAWRVYDAQFWGVPQRRKRIYLIADFATERAGEILFERESVRWDSAEGAETREGTAAHAAGGAGGSRSVWFLKGNFVDRDTHQNGSGWREYVCYTLDATDRHAVAYGLSMACLKGGENAGGMPAAKDIAPTIVAQGCGAVVYDGRGNGSGKVCPTITGDHENRITDYTALAVSIGNGQLHQMSMEPIARPLDCMHDQQAIIAGGKPPRKYIVRRLTPLECMRLQGYPDGWCDYHHVDDLSDEDAAFWEENRRVRALINGVEYKPVSRQRLTNWVNGLGTDSAIYKAAGNSLAIPCAADVIGRIARFVEEERHGN